jgi:hypothetical protein
VLNGALFLVATAGLHAPMPRSPDADTLRIALVVPRVTQTADTMLALGVAQGLAEAARGAALFGGGVVVMRVDAPPLAEVRATLHALRARGVAALIASQGVDASAPSTSYCTAMSAVADTVGVLLVDVGCEANAPSPCHALTFHVMPGHLDESAAFARVAAEERGAAARGGL